MYFLDGRRQQKATKAHLVILTTLSILLMSSSAYADRPVAVGLGMDLGVPDGVGAGVTVRAPAWVRMELAGTYNGASPGVRAGFTLDPVNFGIAPTLTLEGGHAWAGKLIGVPLSTAPKFAYDYLNLHLGLEFGHRDSFRFFLHGGPTWMRFRTEGFSDTLGDTQGFRLGELQGTGVIFPAFKLGFVKFF